MNDARFAVYFVPPSNSGLYELGASLLGYDCYSGEGRHRPADLRLEPQEWEGLTRAPRTYGFHATMKAPFRLQPTCTEAELTAAFHDFAVGMYVPPAINPVVGELGRFIAILPAHPCPAVDQLAADCVTAFDRFRRPAPAAERERRMAAGLSARQIAHLDQWGYPYVLEDFRFHMTLTGPIPAERRAAILMLLRQRFAEVTGPLPIDALVLACQESGTARFRVMARAALGEHHRRTDLPATSQP
ncbi:MAG: phosphonate metabolism protein [Proteobacteria bacterium]|nr:MAG: phosphonate metabolism protein [Pseudomonadota bacterium]